MNIIQVPYKPSTGTRFTQACWQRANPGAGVTQMLGVSGYKDVPCVTRVRHRAVLEVRPD